jgi:hypothetical protein
MPMRPAKCVAAPTSAVPHLDPEHLNTCLDNRPPPTSTPPLAESDPAPQRTTRSQRPTSFVIRNTRRSRNRPSYASIPRYNHYLLARSLVENDHPLKSSAPKQKPRAIPKTVPLQPHRAVLPPDLAISDFIWRFSAPDAQIDDAFAALKSCDPQAFSELVVGFDLDLDA